MSMAPDSTLRLAREIRVAKSTYLMVGLFSAFPLIAGIGCIAEQETMLGIVCVVIGPIMFCYLCLQKITLDGGVMFYRRPFFPTAEVSLSGVTAVRTMWSTGSAGYSRRFFFLSGERVLCAFNPKLFSLEDLACIIAEVHARAPSATIDENTAAFLPADAK